ncbi:lysophospholipid acyltransferase family protein [Thermovibrio sp.]
MRLDKVELLFKVSKLIVKSLKVEKLFLSQPQFPSIVAFWHGRMFLLPFALREYGSKVNILISRHADGELIARLVKKLGFKTIRGSTGKGKGGSRAFLQMLNALKNNEVVAITPDGPRGPREVAKPGVVKLSMASGVPIYPLTFGCKRSIKLNSWDRFVIPYPFAKCKVILGEPIYPQDFKSEEEMRKTLEEKLKEITVKAEGED